MVVVMVLQTIWNCRGIQFPRANVEYSKFDCVYSSFEEFDLDIGSFITLLTTQVSRLEDFGLEFDSVIRCF